MKPKNVRTSIALPHDLHQKLRQEAVRKDCSMRQVIVAAMEKALATRPPKKGRLNLEHGLIHHTGKLISTTSDEIYELGLP